MASLSKDILVSSIESEIQRVTDDLRGVEENLKRLTGRDFTEPRGERRTRVPSTGGREDEPLPKRRPPGGVFARLGEPVSENHRGRRVHEVVEENDAPRHKPSLASSVARPVVDGKSRTEAAAELSKDKVSRERNRRMFGALLGTLQRFRTDEAKQKGKDDQRAKIERKLEEKGRAEKEELLREKMNLISQRKERQALIRRLNFKIERVKEHEAWEVHQKLLENFIRTHNKPCIFWLPKVHQSRTLHLRTQTKNIIERELEEKRMRLKEELDKVLGGKLDAAIRAEEEGDDEEMENGRGREREENSNVDFNNGSDLLDYDAEEGELVFEEDLLLPGKTSGVRKGGSGRGERVVVQVASGLASRPGAQRRVEVVTVSAAERSRRVRGADREAGNESEKENVAALRGRLTVAAAPHTLPPVEPLPRGVRKKENGVALDRGKPAGGRVREREREKEKKGRDKEKDEKEKSSKGGKGKSGNKREEESRSHRKTESVVKDVPERHSKRGERKHHKETKEGESEAKESPLKDKEEKRPSHVESTDVTEPHIPSEDEDKEQEEQDREEEHEQEQEEQEQEETRAEDLSHISLPLDPEPMLEAENDPPPTTGVTEVVVQHVPMEGGGTTDDDAADASGDASEMRVETVLIDTTAIKKDKTEWDQSTTFVMRRPIVIKQEKDASPARHPKVEPGETQPAKNAKAADESSSDSSSDSEDSSSDSEDEEEEEEEEEGEGEDEDAATKGEAASSGSNSSATSSASSSASSSDSESSSSSDSESDEATTGKRKKSDGDRGTTKKRRKREDSSDSSDSSSSSEDEKKKKKKKKEKETISPKKKALSGGGGSKGSSRGSRRDAKEAKGGEKRDERRKGGASKSRSRSRDRDRRRRKSRSKSREKRSRSRDRRRERSKSKDRRRSRR